MHSKHWRDGGVWTRPHRLSIYVLASRKPDVFLAKLYCMVSMDSKEKTYRENVANTSIFEDKLDKIGRQP